jgi:hypothetical protein
MFADTPIFQENHTSAAIDAARISCITALILVELDQTLSEPQKMILADSLEQARRTLDAGRFAALPPDETGATSVHVVGEQPRIIIPGGGT